MFFGQTFLSGKYSAPLMATDLEDITIIKLYDGMYDDLYITRRIDAQENTDIPEKWDNDTIFHAKFNGSTWAGNFGLDMDYISDVLIKKRIKGTNEWTTIATLSVMQAKKPEEFNYSGTDFFVRANHEYEYAVVSYANGLEGNYDISEIECDFECISICEKDKAYSTIANLGTCDMTRTGNGTTQQLLNSKYPMKYKYGESNYDTGSVSGYWVENKGCELDIKNSIDYMYGFKDFLMDGNAKILKHPDGRIWLVSVDEENGVNDSGEEYIMGKRTISFNVTEIGDYNSEKDLYNNDLSDVSQEYWSRGYV